MVSPAFKPIKQEKISAKIVEQIKALIASGKLKPGDALPPERELITQLNVSRPSLREALNTLATMGFIEITQRHRTIVKSLTAGRITEPIDHLLKEDFQTVFELIEARQAIETWNAHHAAIRAIPEDIARLEKCLGAMQSKIENNLSVVEEDANFHLAISEATHNKIQMHLMFSIYDKLKESLGKYLERIDMNAVQAQHGKIVAAIKKNDPDQAEARMREHLDYVQFWVREITSRENIIN
ncbi:MAG: FadR/GntR family transcriptional regulator [Desulfobacteraceae bacterium]|jgi:GntR family transcriptional repressor for pyruvate dehydrogenase complex|nr:FadR/GntR family transcriptional regulator [Desulfobacteraceae bacterium]